LIEWRVDQRHNAFRGSKRAGCAEFSSPTDSAQHSSEVSVSSMSHEESYVRMPGEAKSNSEGVVTAGVSYPYDPPRNGYPDVSASSAFDVSVICALAR
jgi:hypothetical protein